MIQISYKPEGKKFSNMKTVKTAEEAHDLLSGLGGDYTIRLFDGLIYLGETQENRTAIMVRFEDFKVMADYFALGSVIGHTEYKFIGYS